MISKSLDASAHALIYLSIKPAACCAVSEQRKLSRGVGVCAGNKVAKFYNFFALSASMATQI
jgi:hypothetical protein